MKLIAHRGNINGPNAKEENHPDYINKTIKLGYDVEIDVWFTDNNWYLGHDNPIYKIKYDFLLNPRFWIHAKNGEAFNVLLENKKLNAFWHTTEDWVLTSKQYVWTYPNKKLFANSICVLPESGYLGDIKKCHGICSDFLNHYLKNYKK
jgi:hypothetical protein